MNKVQMTQDGYRMAGSTSFEWHRMTRSVNLAAFFFPVAKSRN